MKDLVGTGREPSTPYGRMRSFDSLRSLRINRQKKPHRSGVSFGIWPLVLLDKSIATLVFPTKSEDLVESWTRTKGSGPDSCDIDPWFPSAAHSNRGLTSLRFSACSLLRIGCFRHPNVSGDFHNRGPKTVIYRRLATSITNRVDRHD